MLCRFIRKSSRNASSTSRRKCTLSRARNWCWNLMYVDLMFQCYNIANIYNVFPVLFLMNNSRRQHHITSHKTNRNEPSLCVCCAVAVRDASLRLLLIRCRTKCLYVPICCCRHVRTYNTLNDAWPRSRIASTTTLITGHVSH